MSSKTVSIIHKHSIIFKAAYISYHYKLEKIIDNGKKSNGLANKTFHVIEKKKTNLNETYKTNGLTLRMSTKMAEIKI